MHLAMPRVAEPSSKLTCACRLITMPIHQTIWGGAARRLALLVLAAAAVAAAALVDGGSGNGTGYGGSNVLAGDAAAGLHLSWMQEPAGGWLSWALPPAEPASGEVVAAAASRSAIEYAAQQASSIFGHHYSCMALWRWAAADGMVAS